MTPTGFAQYAENARDSQEDGPRAAKVRTPSGDYHDTWLRDVAEGLLEIAMPLPSDDGATAEWRKLLREAAKSIDVARAGRKALRERKAVADRVAKE